MRTKLTHIMEMAKKDKTFRAMNVMHLFNEKNFKECFYALNKNAARGVDGMSWQEYEKNLEANLGKLESRMKAWQYIPQPAKRIHIPKGDGKTRPLGIPPVEDKIVQAIMVETLAAVFEPDFLDCSYGYRPNRSAHDALKALDAMIMTQRVNHLIDADITGFFDNVDHDILKEQVGRRVGDTGFLRLLSRFLRSGYMEAGEFHEADKGTPQGGVASPILANIYLHYALDQWLEQELKPKLEGFVGMVRYADDFVICVQYQRDAEIALDLLRKRLAEFKLTLSEAKTRLIPFGRYAETNAEMKGKKPDSFDFLGFTHFCDKTRKGGFKVGRKTSGKKLKTKLKAANDWLKKIRSAVKLEEWWKTLARKLEGHFQYYGISGNYRAISHFKEQMIRLAFKWINRRSQKRSMNWAQYRRYLEGHPLPVPWIRKNLYEWTKMSFA